MVDGSGRFQKFPAMVAKWGFLKNGSNGRNFHYSRRSGSETIDNGCPALQVMNPKVDWFFDKDTPWKDAYQRLRSLLLATELTEELKWGCPCYQWNGKNVVLIHGFKNYCALLFHKGSLLDDSAGLLVQQTANVQAARQIRFASVHEVVKLERAVKGYVRQAIEVEKSGRKVTLKKTAEFAVPDEFARRLKGSVKLKKAFEALTPGRQRAYLLHFASAKQSKTREDRIDKSVERILAGQGLD